VVFTDPEEVHAHLVGKASPVHFFWGGADLATTRFSGRPAPKHRGGVPNCPDWVQEMAYSHEVSSCGYWPGGRDEGAFYAYAYPEPLGFAGWPVEPALGCQLELSHLVKRLEARKLVRREPDPADGRFTNAIPEARLCVSCRSRCSRRAPLMPRSVPMRAGP
jgi:Family of unknown function (DUF5996)